MQPDISINILLVDDKPENLFSMAELLDDPSYRTLTARSGKEALRRLLDTEFAVILLDVRMPDMDGFDTAACIRQREQSRHTPIIFVTAEGRDEKSVEKGYAFGAVDYLFKPVVPLILKTKVSVFAELYRKHLRETAAKNRLKQTAKELAASNKELEQFAYIASHDLQEPLRKVRSFTELLALQYKGRLDEKADEFIYYITDGAERMQRLISGLLDYSRITTRAGSPGTADFNRLATEAAKGIDLTLKEAKAILTVNPLPTLTADTGQMIRVFQNLLHNAVKFSGDGPPEITVSADQADPPNGEWRFCVQDRGMGMEPGQCGRVFDLFQRLNSRAKYTGEGMGLAICKKIIQRHQGRIWAESPGPGRGTIICFTLPPAPATHHEQDRVDKDRTTPAKRRQDDA